MTKPILLRVRVRSGGGLHLNIPEMFQMVSGRSCLDRDEIELDIFFLDPVFRRIQKAAFPKAISFLGTERLSSVSTCRRCSVFYFGKNRFATFLGYDVQFPSGDRPVFRHNEISFALQVFDGDILTLDSDISRGHYSTFMLLIPPRILFSLFTFGL